MTIERLTASSAASSTALQPPSLFCRALGMATDVF
jgi:hypothetical protein